MNYNFVKKVQRHMIEVDGVWEQNIFFMGINGYDIACYLCDGVSIWPCGNTVDAKEQTGIEKCVCPICKAVRQIHNQIKKCPRTSYKKRTAGGKR